MSKRPVLNDQQFSLQMQGVSDIYAQMQQELFDNMIKRLIVRGSADLQENPYIWQMQKLNDMHMLNEENLKIITERTGIAEDLLRDVIANEGLKVYKDTKQQLAEDLGRNDGQFISNTVTDNLEAYTSQAMRAYVDQHDFLHRDYSRERLFSTEKTLAKTSADVNKTLHKTQEKEYRKLVSQFGSKAPKSMAEFLEMKYNDTREYKDLKLQERIRSGEYNLKVNGQQNKHILGHHDYKPGRSYLLDDVDAQELVNKYAGTGTIQRDRKNRWRNQEIISISDFVGFNMPEKNGQIELTRTFKIMYGKKGVHIVPIDDKGD